MTMTSTFINYRTIRKVNHVACCHLFFFISLERRVYSLVMQSPRLCNCMSFLLTKLSKNLLTERPRKNLRQIVLVVKWDHVAYDSFFLFFQCIYSFTKNSLAKIGSNILVCVKRKQNDMNNLKCPIVCSGEHSSEHSYIY